MTVHVDTWLGVGLCVGFLIPCFLASIAAGAACWWFLERTCHRCAVRIVQAFRQRRRLRG